MKRLASHLATALLALMSTLSLPSAGAPLTAAAPEAAAADTARLHFSTPSPLRNSAGRQTMGKVMGDLNGDGALDLVVGNDRHPSQFYMNDGYGGFGAPGELARSGGQTSSVALGDLNGDGALDILLGNHHAPSQLYWNDGRGGFVEPTSLPESAETSGCAAVGDLDGDGGLDIVLDNLVYWNDGKGVFGEPVVRADLGQCARPVRISTQGWRTLADLNGDKALDLILVNDNEPIHYLLSDRQRGFFERSDLRNSGQDRLTWSLGVGDLNGDGAPDLVLGNCEARSQIYLNDGHGAFEASTELPETDTCYGLALGDLDGDQDLDIVLDNVAYWNDGKGGFAESATVPGEGLEGVLGDLNGDGALDLVLGTGGGPSQVYLSAWPGHFAGPAAILGPAQAANSVALGDLDGDGALDLVLGIQVKPVQIYKNDGKGGFSKPYDLRDSARLNPSVALGDLDGDGKLDLVLGVEGDSSKVYLNDGRGDFEPPHALQDSSGTMGVALGDLDGDNDLDLALGQEYDPSRIYLNDGRGGFAASYELPGSGDTDKTTSIAAGDLDSDGDLDLILGNDEVGDDLIPSRFYLNDGRGGFLASSELSESYNTRSVVVGDLNGDMALDLVLSGWSSSKIYLNDRRGGFAEPYHLPFSEGAGRMAVGDLNGDGALDLVLGGSSVTQIFLNDRWGGFAPPIAIPADGLSASAVAVGDMDGNGTLDLLIGGDEEKSLSQIYLQHDGFARQTVDTPPSVRVGQPGAAPAVNFYAAPVVLEARTISIPFTLADAEGDTVREVRAEYSLDGGGHWEQAIAANGTQTRDLRASPEGAPYSFVWDTLASKVFGQSDNVVVRLRAIASVRPRANQIAGSYPAAASHWASSMPFRLRGTIPRVVDSELKPVPGAQIYLLPAGSVHGAAPLSNQLDGAIISSNADGYVPSRAPLARADRLAALRVISTTNEFTLYHTSPISLATGLPENAITTESSGVQALTIDAARSLLAFKLSISLEWDARNDTAFIDRLKSDLARTSELLYDWTDGQVALGEVTIYHNKERWEDGYDAMGGLIPGADIQIFASDRLRPNSAQGGIVAQAMTETVTLSGTQKVITYEPGAVHMPATWNRHGDPGGVIGEDWPRTLAHELGHYALFLDDNYLGLDAKRNLIPLAGCTGAMSNPYGDVDSEFRPGDASWAANCSGTLSAQTAGRSDWETITRFYPYLRAPTSFNLEANTGPRRLALGLLQIEDGTQAPPATRVTKRPDTREVYLALNVIRDSGPATYQPSAAARAILYKADGQRAVDLGAPSGDVLLARGAQNGDRVCVYDLWRKLVGCEERLDDFSSSLTLRQPQAGGWQPEVQISAVTSTTIELVVGAQGVGAPAPATLSARVFPDEGPPITVTLSLGSAGYTGSGRLTAPTLGGLVQLWAPDEPGLREAVAEYSLGGDPGPARHRGRHARGRAPTLSADGQAFLFTDAITMTRGQFFAFQTVDQLPAAPDWAAPFGFGYRLLASDDNLRARLKEASLSLSYFSADLPAGAESDIRVYFYPKDGGAWQPLETVVDKDENIASAHAAGEGLYALLASVPLTLKQGWNMIYSYPGADRSLPGALAGANMPNSLVYGYATGDAGGSPWRLFAPGLAEPWRKLVNDLGQLERGASYWFYLSGDITTTLRAPLMPPGAISAGTLGALTPTASTGPGALTPTASAPAEARGSGILGAPPAVYYGLAPVDAGGPLAVEALVGASKTVCGRATTTEVVVDGQKRQGFSIKALANDGAALGCGTPAAPVNIVFRKGDYVAGSYKTTWNNEVLTAFGLGAAKPVAQGPQLAMPDLEIAGVNIVRAPVSSGEGYAIEVTIHNAGNGPIAAPFWVALYLNSDQTPQPGQRWLDAAPFGAAWRVYTLGVGETRTLSTLAPNDPLETDWNYSLLPELLAGETYTLYAQVDVASPDTGDSAALLAERDEGNNLGGPYVLTVGAP